VNIILVFHSSPLHHITPPIARSLLSWSLQGESSQFSPTCLIKTGENPTGFLPLVTTYTVRGAIRKP
jgi:hypothetical protein